MLPVAEEYRALQKALERRYEIRREVGHGANATVFLAQDLRHDRPVALKVLRAENRTDDYEIRFSREIKFLARLQHPSILPLHDSGHVLDMFYYVAPYIEGASLRDRMQRQKRLEVDEAVRITITLAEALDYAHRQGIIHRDIKPENVLLAGSHPMLADFGVARAIDTGRWPALTQPGLGGPGTPAYMSPEQLLGDKDIDARSDIYSLGCVLYEMLAGVAPFSGKEGFVKRFTEAPAPLVTFRSDVPAHVEQSLLRAIERESGDRFATAGEFAAALASPEAETVFAILSPRRRVLSVPATPLIGREKEVSDVSALLERSRLVTLVGPGGVGKTRLAIHVAARLQESFQDGADVIPIIGARSVEDLIANVGEALGVTFAGARPPPRQLIDAVMDRHLLLVLDSFEHLTSDAALFVGELMQQAGRISVLVTSRERLNIGDEAVFEVRGLSTAGSDARGPATQLFVERAQRADASFKATEEDHRQILRIAKSVDGLPLGIEIAASLVRVLDCKEIADELERDLGSIITSRRDIPERHRSLFNVFEHSWALLDQGERSALMRLTVLRGPFRRETAHAVAGARLSVLANLRDKSLVQRREDGRFELHDVVRQFAENKLREEPAVLAAAEETRMRYFGEMVKAMLPDLLGPNGYKVIDRIGNDLEDIRAGWRLAIDTGQDGLVEAYLMVLFRFYVVRGRYVEAQLEFAKAERRGKNDRLAALILARRAYLLEQTGDAAARRLLRRSIDILRAEGPDSVEMGIALKSLAFAASELGKHRAAVRLFDRALSLMRGRATDPELGWCLLTAGGAYVMAGDYDTAERTLKEAVELFTRTGEPRDRMVALMNLSSMITEVGRDAEALELRQEVLSIARSFGDGYLIGAALINLAESAIVLGAFEKARDLLQEAREHHRTIGRPHGICMCEFFAARIERLEGNVAAAESRLRWVLERATALDAIAIVMSVDVELAYLRDAMGRPAPAKNLALLALRHPATSAYDRTRAAKLCAELADAAEAERCETDERAPADIVNAINEVLKE